jgi:hypothetical protein
MRKKIIEKVRAKKELIINDKSAADANQVLSQAAVIGGFQSNAWLTYMRQFVDMDGDHDDQLMRLCATDGTAGNTGLSRARAYLVANGMCGEGTRTRFDENVDTIDDLLP